MISYPRAIYQLHDFSALGYAEGGIPASERVAAYAVQEPQPCQLMPDAFRLSQILIRANALNVSMISFKSCFSMSA